MYLLLVELVQVGVEKGALTWSAPARASGGPRRTRLSGPAAGLLRALTRGEGAASQDSSVASLSQSMAVEPAETVCLIVAQVSRTPRAHSPAVRGVVALR